MKKAAFIGLCFLALSFVSSAQKGNNQVSIGPELDVPVGTFGDAYKIGFGGSVKGLYGIGTAGQLTLTVGHSSFKGKSGTANGYSYADQKYTITPFLAGYRQHFQPFYAEAQVGVATYKTKVTGYNFSETRLTTAIGLGYIFKALDLGLRYQYHTGSSLLALRAAYAINLGKKQSK